MRYSAQCVYNRAIARALGAVDDYGCNRTLYHPKIAGVPNDVALKAAESVTGSDLNHLATKTDLVQTRSELLTQLHQMETVSSSGTPLFEPP
jgi:hypothetical protein